MNMPFRLPLVSLAFVALAATQAPPAHARAENGGHHAHHAHAEPGSDHRLEVVSAQDTSRGTQLELRISDAGGRPVTRVTPTHSRPVHLLITTPDLQALQHVHPEPQRGGLWTVTADLRAPAHYLLFAEFVPRSGTPQRVRTNVNRGGADAPTLALERAVQPAIQEVGPFTVGMYVQPTESEAQRRVTFHVSRDGKPAAFTKYLGERGHAVLFTAGAQRMVHAHPSGDERPGHVSFHVPVTTGEPMRIWGEFIVDGQHIMARSVVDGAVTWEPGLSASTLE